MAQPAYADGYDAPPPVAVVGGFSWTGCYAGLHAGGAWGDRDLTDPVQLVQDQISMAPVTTGVTTVTTSASSWLLGGQIGCNYQFAPHWVIGAEADASATRLRGNAAVVLPLGFSGEQAGVGSRAELIPSFTGRVGYAWDTWLLYVKGGYARIENNYSVIGTFQGTAFDFEGSDLRSGWVVGAGVERALWGPWSLRLEYSYYDFGTSSAVMSESTLGLTGPINVKQTVQAVRLGLNLHPW
jgi:opacity protein-like surface antigen